MTQKFDVCIRGGGIVGRTLALLLAQQRLKVVLRVLPRVVAAPDDHRSGHSDIRAYALNAASRHVLESVRGWPEGEGDGVNPVTPVQRMEVQGDQGGRLCFEAAQVDAASLNWIVDVPALETRLTQALRFQSQVHVWDGTEEPPACALTVVCEGRRSATRAQWGMDYEVKTYPHHALAARLRLNQPHGGVARQWFHQGEILALLPLGGAQGQDVALVWSVPSDKAAHVLGLDAPALTAEIAQLTGIDPADVCVTHAPQSWPLELSQATHWVGAGVALAGDAAHAMHPLAGQGLNVGLGDVAELARVLQAREYWRSLGDVKLLRRYERARKTDFAAMGGLTDGLFTLFNHPHPWVQQLRNQGLNGVNRWTPLKSWLTRQAMG
jgi:2-polyprenyl-6-methoxyphenol hydroxylase-like FAD-dependent oxidoreductase